MMSQSEWNPATWIAPGFLDASRFQNLLQLKLSGQHPVPDLLAHRVVEHLDVIETFSRVL
jgi:hypothetical protein